jgi:nicotinamide mononucleotide transporter
MRWLDGSWDTDQKHSSSFLKSGAMSVEPHCQVRKNPVCVAAPSPHQRARLSWRLQARLDGMNWTEIAGFATGAVCVWLVVIRSAWNFPVGIANNVLFAVLFVNVGLYADAGLQLVYVILAVVGWYWWLKGGAERSGVFISKLTGTQLVACAIGVAALTALLQFGLHRWTNSTVAGWDALTTALSLVAQFMLSRKWIAHWYFWIAADLVYIPLYAYKDLWLTSVLYVIFLIMCVIGLLQWRAAQARRPLQAAVAT